MRKQILCLEFISLLMAGCEEIYTPQIDAVSGQLVVESLLTNNPAQNFVKLSRTRTFYSDDASDKVIGATVVLVQAGGLELKGTESQPGYYTFKNSLVPGSSYMLRINTGNEVFESDMVTMPHYPTIDSLYANPKIEKSFLTDAYGNPMPTKVSGREVCIDIPISPSCQYYWLNCRAILQWVVSPPTTPFPPPPLYGWKSLYEKDMFNIAGPKQFSTSEQIKTHPVFFMGYDTRAYLDSTQLSAGWILIIDQYGISEASYNFHYKLNQQFEAEGSLFDPILTQIYGNIHCKTDPENLALGFFDLNSYRQYRYFLHFGNTDKDLVRQRQLNQYLVIPDNGSQYGIPPEFWEN